jgi:cell division septation protein DedD
MERRQAIILLVLLLVASLASFVVGIVVGRHGGEGDLAANQQIEELMVAPVATVPLAQSVPQRPAVTSAESNPVAVAQGEQPQAELSFYDDLSKEPEVPAEPLGSGINLAPVPKVEPPISLPERPVVVKQAPAVKPILIAPDSAGLPKMDTAGSHAVQIGSFNASRDALALKKKMLDKDYPAYMVEADLADKGLWYRVKVGPYTGASMAKVAQQYLLEQEQIKGFVTRK